MELGRFSTKWELFKHLKDNKDEIIAQKKFEMKRADSVGLISYVIDEKTGAVKEDSNADDLLKKDKLRLKLIINTTKLFDSHRDVHIDGLWKKTLKEPKMLYLLQEHKMAFSNIISDSVKAKTEKISWEKLGAEYDGETEALVFFVDIEKSRNLFMFEQYAKGYVKNHSVGMRYVKIVLCVNSDDKYYSEEKENWEKYYPEVANKEDAGEAGYFWAVTEAKLIEGSAVPMGSNWVTPVQSIKEIEPSSDTQKNNNQEPPYGTRNIFNQIGKKLN